jgi:glucose/arabinose dehydrogenase
MHDRRRRSRSLIVTILAIASLASLAAAPATTAVTPATTPAAATAATFSISLTKVVGGLKSLTQVTNSADGSDRLYVVEQRGTVRAVRHGVVRPGYFLDIRGLVSYGGERGLLGLAFDPHFKTNHRLYVYYTRKGGDIVVARYSTNAAGTNVIESTGRPILLIEHSAAANHNGGSMAFGPDGYLYIGVGDGGGAGDPGNDAQEKTSTLLGKVLRINVHGTGAGRYDRYSIPKTNPYAGRKKGFDEIWDIGLRNPWRISFDHATGKLFIADVGQDRYEEIDREAAGSKGGLNYGWSTMEGMHCYRAANCPMAGDTLPVAEYSHSGGNCAITGGYVYRGTKQANLIGQYVFADFCSGRIWTMPEAGTALTLRGTVNQNITSFGEGQDHELYAVSASGNLYHVVAS